ncbi:hypothetical protein [Actinoplanes sp. RD1]|nr:hypothetical protein [Actinoplanes sp. RD1]
MTVVRMATWRDRADEPPMPGLAREPLDEIDREGSLAQFGRVLGPDD